MLIDLTIHPSLLFPLCLLLSENVSKLVLVLFNPSGLTCMIGLIPQPRLDYWVPKEHFKDNEFNLLAVVSKCSQHERRIISIHYHLQVQVIEGWDLYTVHTHVKQEPKNKLWNIQNNRQKQKAFDTFVLFLWLFGWFYVSRLEFIRLVSVPMTASKTGWNV